MKVNVSKYIALTGYENYSPYALRGFTPVDVRNLPVLDSEVRHLNLDFVLQCVHGKEELLPTMRSWAKKLRIGGKITISDVDAYVVAQEYVKGNLTDIDFNNILMGVSALELRKGLFNMALVVSLLTELGLKVTSKRVKDCEFTVEAIRET